jgi:DNA-binding transcriptional MerR regulator
MSSYISAEKLIERAKEDGINFGKGNPYNRLRYYTKIGWLPHMERMKNEEGEVVGHFPDWVLSRLELIEELKTKGVSNEQIEKQIKESQIKENIHQAFSFINTSEKRSRIVTYLSFLLILVIVVSELGGIPGLKSKQDLISQLQNPNLPTRILESGNSILPSLQKTILVPAQSISETSNISITFLDNYSPASRYWITKKVANYGFYIELDLPAAQDTRFSWFITE